MIFSAALLYKMIRTHNYNFELRLIDPGHLLLLGETLFDHKRQLEDDPDSAKAASGAEESFSP